MLSSLCVSAQNKFDIKGIIADKQTNEVVEGATVQLLSLPDSSFVQGIAANKNGSFVLNGVKKSNYTLKVSFIGYSTQYIDVNLKDKKNKVVDLGTITLSDDNHLLKDAIVSANVSKVQVSGDSLVFNASAYRVPEGSTLEALVKLLPGAQVDENGKITINGKEVTKILLNGKEFFLNDMETAMKNIPVDMIEKIKSYERKSDLARITGIDDGEEETVLDLAVKKDMNTGWFGNINAGGGTEHRYNSRAMINRFNETTKVSLIGNARNTPNRWGWNNGLRSDKRIGMNITDTRKKLVTEGSVMYRHNGSDVMNESSTESFVKNVFGESRSNSYQSNIGLDANAKFEWKPDSMTNVLFRPNFTYSRNRGANRSRSGSYFFDPNDITSRALDYNEDVVNYTTTPGGYEHTDPVLLQLLDNMETTAMNAGQSFNENVRGGMELQYNRKFNNKGRNLTIRVTGNFSDGSSKQLSASYAYQVDTVNKTTTVTRNNRYYTTPSNNSNYSVQVTYNEPIADRTYIQFLYRFYYGYNKNDRHASVYESSAFKNLYETVMSNRYDIDAVLQYMEEINQTLRDTVALSKYTVYKNYNQTFSLQFRRVRDSYNVSAGVDAYPQHTVLDYKYLNKEFPDVKRTVFNMAPRANLRWNFDKQTNLSFRYQGRTSQPSMENLLDIQDDSNPIYKREGNKELKPSFSHNMNLNFNMYKPEPQLGVWFWGNCNVIQNSIDNKVTYYSDGSSLTKPMNIDGNWNIGGGTGMNTGIGEKKLFNAGGYFSMGFRHNVGFYNNANNTAGDELKSITGNTWLNSGLSTSYRNGVVNAELKGDFNLNHSRNNVNERSNQDTYSFSYGGAMQWNMPWGTQVATDIRMSSRRGYSTSDMNTDELLWNASVSHSMLQGKALTLKAEIFDILHQQTNISRAVDSFSRNDSRNNTIYQYALISAIYRFSVYGGKNTMGTDKERRD